MIAVAPNGARKTKHDHPALPLTPQELADTAASCREAGACMIHLHVRNKQGKHSLDPDLYLQAIGAVRESVGQDMIIQITTEAVGVYQPREQIASVRKVKPEAVSLAIRELCPTEKDEPMAAQFFEWLYRERIVPQYILYDLQDIHRFSEMQQRGMIPGNIHTIMLVLGRYSENQESIPEDLDPLLDAIGSNDIWWLCAFGKTESQCMSRAASRGGHCRVGFENNLSLTDGSMAPNNANLVQVVQHAAALIGREPASADQARALMDSHY
ncbi:MAG: class III aminotransferase [Gammaproteobacteria bacterium]|jgi:uncharacterized protein (DUF849 family)|nr:class III aminotransferase [Gammaproteobacteria bacterium]|tara:strand:- start:17658 stop:18464 length:807 start_codon:yes stop_codon:yes gene_type:complete